MTPLGQQTKGETGGEDKQDRQIKEWYSLPRPYLCNMELFCNCADCIREEKGKRMEQPAEKKSCGGNPIGEEISGR